ncbi:hypothetical protein R3P38DRAFT_2823782 [Favolaschia claudopus]|uniref:EKC/KEOPS complex subunit GON7 n=1 Tax=Favolaschia claudopus TaxID=2862362 RepID=A0AAW0EIG7_9AGAR
MSRSIIVEYTINPPPSTEQTYGLLPSKKHDFEIKGSPAESGQSEHYKSLRESIAQARQQIGEELTAWRDAVGKAELNKEATKPNADDEEEEEEDGDA